jgi:PHD/YefM family antitoxin component YafN of YafNO toxin-antitoxin module
VNHWTQLTLTRRGQNIPELGDYIDSDSPVAVTGNGQTVGYCIPRGGS